MSPTATEQTVTLPATLVTLPASAADWKVTKQRSMRTSDGVAFVATLAHKGKVVGEIENQGNGGGTWFRHHDVAAREAFDAFVKETEDAGLAVMTDKYGINGGEPFPVNGHEFVADALANEHDLVKRLNRAAKTKTVLIGPDDDPAEGYGTISAPWSPEVEVIARRNFPGGFRVWSPEAGWQAK